MLKTTLFKTPFRKHFRASFTSVSKSSSTFSPSSVVFSGIQPTGIPHLGNYLGAIQNWISLQNNLPSTTRIIFSIVDLHALTVPQHPTILRNNIIDLAKYLLACGIDPKRTILYVQSHVKEHSELGWILGCRTPIPWLKRMHQWKSKLAQLKETNSTAPLSLGLLAYPVLQAADILLYRATHVPVGEDQQQHLELTREIAQSINSSLNQSLFTLPQSIYTPTKRIMSLRFPHKKMSKSDPSPDSRIELSDSPEQIRRKIRKATTDSEPFISYDLKLRPGISNLIQIYSGLKGWGEDDGIEKALKDLGSCQRNSDLKNAIGECIINEVTQIQERLKCLEEKGDDYIVDILRQGEKEAAEIASKNMAQIKDAFGV